MNINDVLRAYRGSAKQIESLTEESYSKYASPDWTYEDFKTYTQSVGADINNFVVTEGVMNNIFYTEYETGSYIDCMLSKEYFEIMQFEKRLEQVRLHQKRLLGENKYESFYFMIPKPMKVFDFQKRYKDINIDKVAETWIDIYTSLDYGFDVWDKEVLEYVFKYHKPSKKKGSVTIYRGVGTQSTPIEQSYSWTTDLNVALWFATRKGLGKSVAKATVNWKDVLFYTNERSEKEVIVRFKDLKEVGYLDLIPCDEEFIKTTYQLYGNDYMKYGSNIDNNWFSFDDHDFGHSARVLFNTLMLSGALKLTSREKQILAYCSILHDIGRDNNGVDTKHGVQAVKRIEEEGISFDNIYLNNNHLYLAKKIIEYHCIDDKDAHKLIYDDKKIIDKDKAIRLYTIFKDADCLDRVRFNNFRVDFDINYLRLTISKKRLLVVAGLHYYGVHKVFELED